ncbi:MAG: hypothetical protein HYY06_03780 [Deltaproteobacteria bacterium]|nr:hypothetical protein [Deltaproteobacteria bacterium]
MGGGLADLCVADCIVDATESAISQGCANCYEDSAYCAAGQCLALCIGEPDEPECVACRCDQGCVAIFESCSGIATTDCQTME